MNMESQYRNLNREQRAKRPALPPGRAARDCILRNVFVRERRAPACRRSRSADRGRRAVGGRQVPCSLALAAALCACGSSARRTSPSHRRWRHLRAHAPSVEHHCLAPSLPPGDRTVARPGAELLWPVLSASACRRQPLLRGAKGGIVSAVSPDGADASDFIDITSKTNSATTRAACSAISASHPRVQGYCGTAPVVSEMGVPGAAVAPGHPEKSLVRTAARVHPYCRAFIRSRTTTSRMARCDQQRPARPSRSHRAVPQ